MCLDRVQQVGGADTTAWPDREQRLVDVEELIFGHVLLESNIVLQKIITHLDNTVVVVDVSVDYSVVARVKDTDDFWSFEDNIDLDLSQFYIEELQVVLTPVDVLEFVWLSTVPNQHYNFVSLRIVIVSANILLDHLLFVE